jgi:tetratricopeptide (TPR) repeat protein
MSSDLDLPPQLADLHQRLFDMLGKGQFQSALPLATELRDEARRQLDVEHPYYAASLHNLAGTLQRLGDLPRAESLYRQALDLCRRHRGEGHPDHIACLLQLAQLWQIQEQAEQAEATLREALDIARRHPEGDGRLLAVILYRLAELRLTQGDAEPLAREAVVVARSALGEQHPDYLACVAALGMTLAHAGNYAEGESLLRQSAEHSRQLLGDDHPLVATRFRMLANVLLAQQNFIAAEPVAEQAVALARQAGIDSVGLFPYLNDLVKAYRGVGKYAAAEPLARQALKTAREELGEDHPVYASCLNDLASLHLFLHNYPSAEALLRQALAFNRKYWGETHSDTLASACNLAELYRQLGQHSAALTLLEQVQEAVQQGGDLCASERAQFLGNLGLLYLEVRRWDQAEQLLSEARELGRQALGENHPGFASILNNLALVHNSQGRYAEAETHFQEALRILARRVGENHPNFVDTLSSLGLLYAATGRAQEALPMLERAESLSDRLIEEIVSLGSESHRASYLRSGAGQLGMWFLLSLVLRDLADSPAAMRAALDLVLRRKAIGTEALTAQREAVLGGQYAALEPQLRELAELRGRIAECLLAGPGPQGPDRQRRQLAQWNAVKDRLEAELARAIPELSLARKLRTADSRAVSRALPEGSALVEFVCLRIFDYQALPARGELEWQPPRYVAFVLPAADSEEIRLIDLGEAGSINQLIADFRADITGEAEKIADRNLTMLEELRPSPAPTSPGLSLREAVFDPLAVALAGRRRLLLATDGDLTRLPFEVLPLARSRHLLDDYQISYVGTGRDVIRFGVVPSTKPAAPVVIADPDFDLDRAVARPVPGHAPFRPASGRAAPSTIQWGSDSPARPEPRWAGSRVSRDLERSSVRFNRLPGTRMEGEQVAHMLGIAPWLGGAALKSRLKECRSPRILHLATHGFFLEDQILERSPDELGWRGGAPSGHLPTPEREDSLLRSGLALCGANTWLRGGSPPPEAEDGLLTAEDVAGLHLLATDLVVLSACQTALGKIEIGEGVFGLRRSFQLAGAKTLVMSLWKVPDLATAFLMDCLYHNLLARGLDRDLALSEAQRATRDVTVGQLRAEWLSGATIDRFTAGDAEARRALVELARKPDGHRPFEHPFYWGAFICQGDTAPLPAVDKASG